MKIKWYGHAAFRLMADDGRSLILDPYTPEEVGYRLIEDVADGCIVSSDNDIAHCRADLLPGPPTTVNALTLARTGGVGEAGRLSPSAPSRRWKLKITSNTIPTRMGCTALRWMACTSAIWAMSATRSLAEQCDFFAGIDVLLALAGGHPTIELDELMDVIRVVRPPLVVPMHFRTLTYKPRNTFWLGSFLEHMGEEVTDFAYASEVTITRAELPSTTRMLVLRHSN